jgi:hypothetical protein
MDQIQALIAIGRQRDPRNTTIREQHERQCHILARPFSTEQLLTAVQTALAGALPRSRAVGE